jgi:predicted transport protein
MVRTLHLEMLNQFPDIISKVSGNYYTYHRGKEGTTSRFVGLILNKNDITIRIRVEPTSLSDPKKIVGDKKYDWFFKSGKGEERMFRLSNKDQIPYAMELIKQSYELAK